MSVFPSCCLFVSCFSVNLSDHLFPISWIYSYTQLVFSKTWPVYKLLKKSSETQVWLTISLLLPELIFLTFGIIGKPCYSSLQWCAICYDYAICSKMFGRHIPILQAKGNALYDNSNAFWNISLYTHPPYSGVLHIPKLRNHNKWHIIVKRNNRAFQWYQMQGKWVGNKREIVSQTWVSELFLRSLFTNVHETYLV